MNFTSDFSTASFVLVLWLAFGHYFRWGGAQLNEPYRSIFNYTFGTLGLVGALAYLDGLAAGLLFRLAVVGGVTVVVCYAVDAAGNYIKRVNRENRMNAIQEENER